MRLTWSALLVCGSLCCAAAAQEESSSRTPQKQDIYDAKADVKQLVANAAAKAKRDHSRVLVMFGGNWCGWCHKLHDVFKSDREIARVLLYEYQLVMADTQAPNAEALMKDLKVDTNAGVPYLVVLDGDGNVVTRQETGSLEEGNHHDRAKVLAFLKQHAAKAPSAETVLEAAKARAASEQKPVFLHFGAPWCGWCHRLEDFLAEPEIATLWNHEFVDVKIDTDRMEGGQDLLAKYCPKPGGIPWFVILDQNGQALVTSDSPRGNVGYPVEPHEIEHFIAMLKKASRQLSPDQIKTIETGLQSRAAKLKSQQ